MGETIVELLNESNQMLKEQRKVYLASVKNINMRYGELLKNDFGSTLVKNCAKDAAGEVVRRFFDTSDYYITVDQLYDRIINFSYEHDIDPLSNSSETIRKNFYNMNDDPRFSSTLKDISNQCQSAQKKLFVKDDTTKRYVDSKTMEDGKKAYRKEQQDADGKLYDKLSGNSSDSERLEVDHVQAAATARYNSKYLNTPEAIQALKDYYNSSPNFQMLEKRANGSKGDVRVYANGNKLMTDDEVKAERKAIRDTLKKEYLAKGMDDDEANKKASATAEEEITRRYDVTFKASAKEVSEAVCRRWENTDGETKAELIRTGKLDKNGKVPANVKNQLEKDLRTSMNAESKVILKNMNYSKVASDSLEQTKKGLSKIIAGQVIYYVLPPVVLETQTIIRKKDMTIERFLKELKASGKRIIRYVESKLGEIFKNIVGNSFNKFIKAFFDILIETVKETVKKLLKIAKNLVLSLVQCVKIVASPDASPAAKADAVTRTLSVTATSVVLEILFEYLEKQFGLPDIIMEPLQIIVTIIATNLIMLILQKADLFDEQYGLLIANIDDIFKEEFEIFENISNDLLIQSKCNIKYGLEQMKNHLSEVQNQIKMLNLYEEDITTQLNTINKIYDIGIDFDQEWLEYQFLSRKGGAL